MAVGEYTVRSVMEIDQPIEEVYPFVADSRMTGMGTWHLSDSPR